MRDDPWLRDQGRTRDEAIENIREAIALCLEVRAEKGFPLTIETRQVELSLSIPDHRELDRGTLRSLIRSAGITVDEFLSRAE